MISCSIIGAIGPETTESLAACLGSAKGPIRILLASDGGDPRQALAIIGLMSQCTRKITVEVYGTCMSAATIILSHGKHRRMHKDAWFMVHDGEIDLDGSDADKRAAARQQERECLQWATLLERTSNFTSVEWYKRAKDVTYMSAQECLSAGVIDEIIG